MPFVKGQKSGNPAGRPKGSKDKSYLTLQYWYNELMKDWASLSPATRAKTSVQLMTLLTSKLKAIPGSPDQSAINAQSAQEMLKELEAKKPVVRGKNDSDGVSEPSQPSQPL